MEAVVPCGGFVGLRLPGFGGGSVGHFLIIAHMIGLFKGVVQSRSKSTGFLFFGGFPGALLRLLARFSGVDLRLR